MMNKDIFEKLKPYESQLNTAIKCDYARNITKEGFSVLNAAYKELFNKDSNLGSGCGKCQLNNLKQIARLYFEYKEKMAQKMEKARLAREEKNKVVENEQGD